MEQSTLDNDNPDEYFSEIIEMDLDGSCSSSTLSGPPPKKKKKTDISLLAEIAQERLEQQKDHHVRQEKMVEDLISTQTKFQNDLLEHFPWGCALIRLHIGVVWKEKNDGHAPKRS
ncbi:uncharacterized protein [Drosophila pseudoobscura]|uniref:Uncharacterized protein n=1 Tax=Drosophila pseudoobscura pseudoobscura TaxID=46245 RepID=A0A6I8VCN6_DROPS|nr:uncharacterized protein LOC26532031 [Drosophila pseudoobscura]